MLVPAGPGAKDPEKLYILNGVGLRIWQLLNNKGWSAADIADEISKEFTVTKDKALADVIKYLEELKQIGAIET